MCTQTQHNKLLKTHTNPQGSTIICTKHTKPHTCACSHPPKHRHMHVFICMCVRMCVRMRLCARERVYICIHVFRNKIVAKKPRALDLCSEYMQRKCVCVPVYA